MALLKFDTTRENISKIFSGVNFFSSGFGVGALPASGTWGSLLGCFLFYLLSLTNLSNSINIAILMWGLIVGFYLCDKTGKSLGKPDHGAIVWDEIIAMMLVLQLMPNIFSPIYNYLLAFLLFRFFDIVKIYPANIIDKYWHNGVGVMLDDIVAAIYALLVIQLIFIIWNL